MSQLQNYEVSYVINVEASEGVRQVQAFAQSIESLSKFRGDFGGTATKVSEMMAEFDKVFKNTDGKKKDYAYKFDLDTKNAEGKLTRIKTLVTEIRNMSNDIKLVVNPGKALNSKAVKKNAQQLIAENKTAGTAAGNVMEMQRMITRSIGKINSALTHLQKGRELNIKTDVAKRRLNEILGLLGQINSASRGVQLGVMGGRVPNAQQSAKSLPASRVYQLPSNVRVPFVSPMPVTPSATTGVPKSQQIIPAGAVSAIRSHMNNPAVAYGARRRAAINRLQYSKPPTMRSLMPFAYMLNGYMLYSVMKRELTNAVEYTNIMESARSILKVADEDLSTFEDRFEGMAKNVRTVGVETKFTAVEVAGAVKYLAMAGQSIDTINKSIRPITNLALIGDNDLSQIADLTTNIMAGYNIRPESMDSVADIIASTISRSNVNIIETAESFKMAAGFLQSAGVDFSESSAAVGLLGNMGIKGTMAGTALRAMATRFANQPREARKTLDRLGVDLFYYDDVYGSKVQKLRPLADIFRDFDNAGATLQDMYKIFGRIGANGAMMLIQNHEKLRKLATQNQISHGISGELAFVKQETTKGLWYQVTSQLSETFMQGFEILEPKIQMLLRDFLAKFKAPEFARGLASLAGALLDIFSVLGKIATWFGRNFSWLEPIIFTGLVATRLFKMAGAVTNLGIALGFLGKQGAAASGMKFISGIAGLGGQVAAQGVGQALSFASKRALVKQLSALGISGKGAMTAALGKAGLAQGLMGMGAQGAASGLFATQVVTGKGLLGAGASIGALGTTAVVATAGIAALVGALGWVAYKTWKIKEAKDAVIEDVNANKKYRYKSIEDLYDALDKTAQKAKETKQAVDSLNENDKLKDKTGHSIGWFTGNWWKALGYGALWAVSPPEAKPEKPFYTFRDARLDNLNSSLETYADMNVQTALNSAWQEFGAIKDPLELEAFIQNIDNKYGMSMDAVDSTLFRYRWDGQLKYDKNGRNMTLGQAVHTAPYIQYFNKELLPSVTSGAKAYHTAISSYEGAKAAIEKAGFNFSELEKLGFRRNEKGDWEQNTLPKDATDEQKVEAHANFMKVRDALVMATSSLRKNYGDSAEATETIMQRAGFRQHLYANEPQKLTPDPFNDNDLTTDGLDDGGSGGNYSGTGKLSSAAPKQVIVNITNLMSVDTIDLLKTPEGQTTEVQNLKEQLAQALIDVVHDFDASWNG